jgi:hypothetical protein
MKFRTPDNQRLIFGKLRIGKTYKCDFGIVKILKYSNFGFIDCLGNEGNEDCVFIQKDNSRYWIHKNWFDSYELLN